MPTACTPDGRRCWFWRSSAPGSRRRGRSAALPIYPPNPQWVYLTTGTYGVLAMPPPVHILKAKPDPRGRLALGKAIEAVNRFLATSISGFDCLMNSDGSLTLKPMVEVEARGTFRMHQSEWVEFNAAIVRPTSEPNAKLRAASKAFKSRVQAGTIVLSPELEERLGPPDATKPSGSRRNRAPAQITRRREIRVPRAAIKQRKKP